MICEEVIMEFLVDYLDGKLNSEVLAGLEQHLQDCKPCVAYLNTYKKTRELTGQAARVEMPEEMKDRLREFLLRQLAKGK